MPRNLETLRKYTSSTLNTRRRRTVQGAMRPPFHYIRSRGTDEEAERSVRGQLDSSCPRTALSDMEVALSRRRADSESLNGSAIFTGTRALANVAAQHVKENHCNKRPTTLLWLLERKMCAACLLRTVRQNTRQLKHVSVQWVPYIHVRPTAGCRS
jgi:hypothetical protein